MGLCENVPRHTTSPAPGGGCFQILPLDHDESLRETKSENKIFAKFLGNCLS